MVNNHINNIKVNINTSKINNIKQYSMYIALIFIWIFFIIMTGGTFMAMRNLSNLSRQVSIIAILATGMTLVIITGNIDLSVGSLMGLIGAICAVLQAWYGYNYCYFIWRFNWVIQWVFNIICQNPIICCNFSRIIDI
jgi:ABC-type xylose transport system permease subunit